MAWLITLVVGALIGWLASLIMQTDAEQGTFLNIVIGVVGAALGRWLLGGVMGIGGALSAGSLSVWGIAFGVLGAVILIALLKAVRVLR